ncbi:MAG: hypothetical protein HW387_579 [Parachlamydiales bacterium]|nr:hypothetical protein [Parachlamydiales bacterium]
MLLTQAQLNQIELDKLKMRPEIIANIINTVV